MTVGETLNIKVGVQVLLEEEKSALAKSLASDVTSTFWQNYKRRFSHKFQSSQYSESSQGIEDKTMRNRRVNNMRKEYLKLRNLKESRHTFITCNTLI